MHPYVATWRVNLAACTLARYAKGRKHPPLCTRCFLECRLLLKTVAALQALHPPFSVHNTLLSRKEWVACAAYLHSQESLGSSYSKGVAAGADDLGLWKVFRMYLSFHWLLPGCRLYHIGPASLLSSVVELNPPIHQGEQGVVAAHPYIEARTYPGSALADNDAPCGHMATAVALDAQSLAIAVATVATASSTLLMGHG